MKKFLLAMSMLFCTSPAHAIFGLGGGGEIVFDPQNFAKNVEQVIEMMQQLEDMKRNSAHVGGVWAEVMPFLVRYAQQLCSGQALGYCDPHLLAVFRQRFPGFTPYGQDWRTQYRMQTQTVLDTLSNALRVAQQQAAHFAEQDARLQTASTKSERAVGRLQAIQAGNMMLAEGVRQQIEERQAILTLLNAVVVAQAQATSETARMKVMEADFLTQKMPAAWPVYGTYGRGQIRPVQ